MAFYVRGVAAKLAGMSGGIARPPCSTRAEPMLCQIEHIPLHLGSFIGIITEIVKRRPVEKLRPGDVLIGNDAYAGGGTHLPDIVLGEPIFVDGRLVAWAVNPRTTRISSIAGTLSITKGCASRRSGSIVPRATGTCARADPAERQVPCDRLSDVGAQMAALGAAHAVTVRQISTDTVLAVGDALQDYAERKMRAGIAALPDGTYRFEDTYDNPEFGRALPVSVEVTIVSDDMRLHFESPPQVCAGINMIHTALLSRVYYAVKAVVNPTILNSGLARPLTVTAPAGTIFNAVHPAAINGRTNNHPTRRRSGDRRLSDRQFRRRQA